MKSTILLLALVSSFSFAHETADEHKHEAMKKFDIDQDGKLSASEKAERRKVRKAQMLEKHDADGDGKLSKEERASFKDKRKSRRMKRKKAMKESWKELSPEERKARMKSAQ